MWKELCRFRELYCEAYLTCNLHELAAANRYFKFSNPGSLLIPMDQFYHGGESVCRNKYLQQMFTLMGAAEKAGSGADKILQGWKEADYRSPELKERTQPDKVELKLPLVNLLSADILSFLKSHYGEAFNSLTHDELMTLATCYSEGEVTNYRLQIIIDKHSADITKLLKVLCDKGFLISCGFGRGTKYQLNEEYEPSLLQNDDSKGVSKGVRSSSEKVKKNILEICSDYASIEEIAAKVGKSIVYLKNKIIPQMLADGLLEWQYPNAPRHPYQKYRTKK